MISAPPRPPRLGPRLRHLADVCPAEAPVADVGSGHGRLALELARRLPGAVVYATEARPGPAAELRRLLGPAPTVTVLDGAGLTPLAGLGCRGAVIAGMGGHTILGILEERLDVAGRLAWLCLQPVQDREPLERWLDRRDWLVQAAFCWERGRRYHSYLVRPR